MDRDKMSNLYKEPSIDVSYQISVHLAEGFQRRKLTVNKHGHHRPFLFLKGLISKNLLL
jgi:hypothetical protein